MSSPVVYGLALNLALLMAIGPQSLFLMREGLLGRRPYLLALLFLVSDLALFSAGLMGVGSELAARPALAAAALWISVLFLIFYGCTALKSAWSRRGDQAPSCAGHAFCGIKGALAVTFLNPWVYMDTLLLIPGASAGLSLPERFEFGFGAIAGSTIWFFGLAAAAGKAHRLLVARPVPIAFDCLSGVIVWSTAAMLALGQL